MIQLPPTSPLFPYTTLFRSHWWDSSDFPAWLPQYSDQPYPLVIAGMYMNSWPRALEIFGDHLTPEFKAFGERRSEEHTSELQSRENLVCRLLLEKKKKT